MVKVTTVSTAPQFDLTHPERETTSHFWIDPRKRVCGVEQNHDGGGTAAEIYHGFVLSYDLENNQYDSARRVEASELHRFLKSDEAQAQLDRICDGWYEAWDGRNRVGVLDKDAKAAIDELLGEIASLTRVEMSVWLAEEWLETDYPCGVTGETTDAEIREIADRIEAEARAEHVVIDDDVVVLLTTWRDELKGDVDEDQWELDDDEDEDDEDEDDYEGDEDYEDDV